MDSKKSKTIIFILSALLILLVICVIYVKVKIEKQNALIHQLVMFKDNSEACNNDSRYPKTDLFTAEEVGVQDASSWVGEYRDAHREDNSIYKTTGFHISKKALDSIFSRNLRTNSITLNLINQGDTSLGLIVAGVHSDTCDVIFNSTYNSSIFRVFSLCPTDCCLY